MNPILKNILRPPYRLIKGVIQFWSIKRKTDKLLYISNDVGRPRVFYFGVTEHSNLGDLAQYYCIKKWIKENYPTYELYEFEATTIVDNRFNFIDKLSKIMNDDDIIIFQSGYTTTDLGGHHDLMHRIIIDRFSSVNILMMPQTVFFKSEERKLLTSNNHNQAKRLLFLARDRVSCQMACTMFPDIVVKKYPDIVTSLIGKYNFDFERNAVLFCCRDDDEKFYSDDQINSLRAKVEKLLRTDMKDTTIHVNYKKIKKKLQYYIENEISTFARYKLVVTDRYHGTIFALVANTPVIVLKTNDHKVTTGVEWFNGIYGDYVFLAESLEHAYDLVEGILRNKYAYKLEPHYNTEYYQKLKEIAVNVFGK